MTTKVALGDAEVAVTVTLRCAGSAVDLSGYNTLEVIIETPTGTLSTLAGVAGASTGEIDATIPVFSTAGTWKIYGRARDTVSGAQRTSHTPALVQVAGGPA